MPLASASDAATFSMMRWSCRAFCLVSAPPPRPFKGLAFTSNCEWRLFSAVFFIRASPQVYMCSWRSLFICNLLSSQRGCDLISSTEGSFSRARVRKSSALPVVVVVPPETVSASASTPLMCNMFFTPSSNCAPNSSGRSAANSMATKLASSSSPNPAAVTVTNISDLTPSSANSKSSTSHLGSFPWMKHMPCVSKPTSCRDATIDF
mmetsp:Transcript_39572/g.77345  ORF Transcript_39572/g.77345 Transcript_39572/m.77345 type:complete len:207 (-) Transcript_39572:437-1057(-)